MLYITPTIPNEIILDANPIIIPSIIKGVLIKPFVAPTYFIIEISFLLACTVNFIVLDVQIAMKTIKKQNNLEKEVSKLVEYVENMKDVDTIKII